MQAFRCKKGITMKRTLCGKVFAGLLFFITLILLPGISGAYSNHPLIAYPVFSTMPEVSSAEPVVVEGLESFLAAEEKGLVELFAKEEEWLKSNLGWYAPRPDAIAFKATGDKSNIKKRFCYAARINPNSPLSLYFLLLPGKEANGRNLLPSEAVKTYKGPDYIDWGIKVELKEGEKVAPLDVLSVANDEPDYGMDLGLYVDNGTDYGREFGLGNQPFGNPNLVYGSQAPFHMGFYYESKIVFKLGGFLKKTNPLYRIHLFKSLAEFAFKTGHDYWGWRFAGWGLHYVCDLSHPYHSRMLPGVSTARILWMNLLNQLGMSGAKNDAIQIVSNRHSAVEKFQRIIMRKAYLENDFDSSIFKALKEEKTALEYTDDFARTVIAKIANDNADRTDRLLEEVMPEKFVFDTEFELGTSPEAEEIVDKVYEKKGQEGVDKLTDLIADLLKPFAAYGRLYVKEILKQSKK